MNKKEIRQKMKKQRANLSSEMVDNYSHQITEKICQLPLFKLATKIFVYSSMGNEVDTSKLVEIALKNNKLVAYPSTNMTYYTMAFYQVDHPSHLRTHQSGQFKLKEPLPHPSAKVIPDQNTLMIVPGLAFDNHFCRIGYGGGFYDKYLERYPRLQTLGVCYDFQMIPSVYPDPHDQPVASIMTPSKYWHRKSQN